MDAATQGPTHGVRAMAFHHSDRDRGVTSRALARTFAGPNGRLATCPDIAQIRLANDINASPWRMQVGADTRAYVGYSDGDFVIAVTHGTGPRSDVSDSSHVTNEEFDRLVQGAYGAVQTFRLSAYDAHIGKYDKARRGSYVEVRENPFVTSVFGTQAEAYLRRLSELHRGWMTGHTGDEPVENASILRLEMWNLDLEADRPDKRDRLRKELTDGDCARLYRVSLSPLGLWEATDGRPRAFQMDVGFYVGPIDEGNGFAKPVVGIRPGDGPVTFMVPWFERLQPGILARWEGFVEPMAPVETPAAAPAQGPRKLIRHGGALFALADRDAAWYDQVPAGRAVKVERIPFTSPLRVSVSNGDQEDVEDAIDGNAPEGATAFLLAGHTWGERGGDAYIDVDVEYYRCEVDERPFHVLMRVGDAIFSQYPMERCSSMDIHLRQSREPRHPASVAIQVGKPRKTRRPSDDETRHNPWLDMVAMRLHAPDGANAILLDEHGEEWTYYHVNLDETRGFRRLADHCVDVHGTAAKLEAMGLA